VIENLLRHDLILGDEAGFAPLDNTAGQLLFRLVSAASERRAPFGQWGRFLPEHTTTVSLPDRLLRHAHVVVTDGDFLPVPMVLISAPRPAGLGHAVLWPAGEGVEMAQQGSLGLL